MRFRVDNSSWNQWQQPVTTFIAKISEKSEGIHKVYVQLKDEAGNRSTIDGSIIFDITPPYGRAYVNQFKPFSAPFTSSSTLQVFLRDVDDNYGVDKYRINFVRNGKTIFGAWQKFKEKDYYHMPVTGEGKYWFFVQVADKAGNEAIAENNYIIYDKTPPTGILWAKKYFIPVSDPVVTLYMNKVTDALSPICCWQYGEETTEVMSSWKSFSSKVTFSVSATSPAEKIIYIKIKDYAGNVTEYSFKITITSHQKTGFLMKQQFQKSYSKRGSTIYAQFSTTGGKYIDPAGPIFIKGNNIKKVNLKTLSGRRIKGNLFAIEDNKYVFLPDTSLPQLQKIKATILFASGKKQETILVTGEKELPRVVIIPNRFSTLTTNVVHLQFSKDMFTGSALAEIESGQKRFRLTLGNGIKWLNPRKLEIRIPDDLQQEGRINIYIGGILTKSGLIYPSDLLKLTYFSPPGEYVVLPLKFLGWYETPNTGYIWLFFNNPIRYSSLYENTTISDQWGNVYSFEVLPPPDEFSDISNGVAIIAIKDRVPTNSILRISMSNNIKDFYNNNTTYPVSFTIAVTKEKPLSYSYEQLPGKIIINMNPCQPWLSREASIMWGIFVKNGELYFPEKIETFYPDPFKPGCKWITPLFNFEKEYTVITMREDINLSKSDIREFSGSNIFKFFEKQDETMIIKWISPKVSFQEIIINYNGNIKKFLLPGTLKSFAIPVSDDYGSVKFSWVGFKNVSNGYDYTKVIEDNNGVPGLFSLSEESKINFRISSYLLKQNPLLVVADLKGNPLFSANIDAENIKVFLPDGEYITGLFNEDLAPIVTPVMVDLFGEAEVKW